MVRRIQIPAPTDLKERLKDKLKVQFHHLGHFLRTKHQGEYYQFVQKNLKPGECVAVINYKMKLELSNRSREIQRDWYGKRGYRNMAAMLSPD